MSSPVQTPRRDDMFGLDFDLDPDSSSPGLAGRDRPTPDATAYPADGPLDDRAAFLLEYAILAPSSHNSQPWAFAVDGGEVRVYADESRRLDVADPDGRELYVSVGCALENLVVAAARFGLGYAVEYVDDPAEETRDGTTDRHVATVRLDPDSPPTARDDALFEAIADRRTNHVPFDDRPVPGSLLERFEACATAEGLDLDLLVDPTLRGAVADLQTRADERQFDDPAYRVELGRWIGAGALGANWLVARVARLAVRHLDLGEREGQKDSGLLESAPAVGVLAARTEDAETRLRVGRAFERIALIAESEGVAVHPMSQILEVEELRGELGEMLATECSTPMHLLRVGYADRESTQTPRRPVEDVLR